MPTPMPPELDRTGVEEGAEAGAVVEPDRQRPCQRSLTAPEGRGREKSEKNRMKHYFCVINGNGRSLLPNSKRRYISIVFEAPFDVFQEIHES